MKKTLKYLSFIIISYFVLLSSTYAASLSLSRSSATVSSGSTVKITAKISGASSYTYSNFALSYDQEKFSFVSAPDSCNGLNCLIEGNGSVTFTFQAKSNGSGTFSASGVFEDDTTGNLSSSTSVTVGTTSNNNTVTNNTNLSSNNNLTSLTIENQKISPEFNKDITEYSVNLSKDITSILVEATPEDKKAKVTGIGSVEVSEGINTIEIIVTAENGNKKSYIIKATVEEKNPIKVKVNNSNFTVVKNKELLQTPSNYEEKTVEIEGIEVPAFYSELTKFTLVGLKDEDGNIELYIYDAKDNTYTLYKESTFNNIRFYAMNISKTFRGYKKYEVDVNGNKVKANKISKDSSYAIVYGMDLDSGKKNYYMYDIENNTLQIYNDEQSNILYKTLDLYSYILLGAGGFILLLLIIIIILCVKNSKRKKKIRNILNKIGGNENEVNEKVINKEDIVDDVLKQDDEEEMYNILDE